MLNSSGNVSYNIEKNSERIRGNNIFVNAVTNAPIYIFDTYLTDTSGLGSIAEPAIAAKAKLYSFAIRKNNNIIRNFVPCINPSGEIGLYDFVTKQFYGNAGTGEFLITLPSEYKKLEYIESTGTQYIDTGYKPTSENLKIEYFYDEQLINDGIDF